MPNERTREPGASRCGLLKATLAPRGDPWAEWYGVYRARETARRKAEATDRARMAREIRWMTALIAVWSLVMGAAAALAIWLVL